MRNFFSQLSKPFSYLFIKGIGGKAVYDWIAPFFLTLFSLGYFYLFNISEKTIIEDGGVIKTIASFISNLPGFYIAALAAIATFNREQIDHPLINDKGSPSIDVRVTKENGHVVNTTEPLTRRLFLCMLFAYLTALSIFIIIMNAFISPLLKIYSENLFPAIYIALFLFLSWQMLISTFFSLYYLGNRIHLNY
ncbi:hypothetical protein SOK14_004011 [Cronobacter turicensis]|nr:hypothetical protein [Cronobacter turicensis]